MGRTSPPPAGLKSPPLWGSVPHCEQLFEGVAGSMHAQHREYTFRYLSAEHFIDVFRTWYGPVHKAFAALPADEALREARSAITAAQALQPDLAEAYASQGLLEIELQHYALAISLLEQAVHLDPGLSHARAWHAMALTLDGRLAEAETMLEEATPRDPGNTVLQTTLSMNLILQARWDSAEQVLAGGQAGLQAVGEKQQQRVGVALGGDPYTFAGLAGMGRGACGQAQHLALRLADQFALLVGRAGQVHQPVRGGRCQRGRGQALRPPGELGVQCAVELARRRLVRR